MQLVVKNSLPTNFSEIPVSEIHDHLGGPCIVHLKGKDSARKPLFISILLHGNETSSYFMMQRFLDKHKTLERDIILLFGNTIGTKEGMRHMPDQVDYNRIWEEGRLPENKWAMEVRDYAKKHNIFASIDLHNNTGKNPHYACINKLDPDFKNLASHFGEFTIYFTEPHNVQSMCFSKVAPSVTIEAGLPGSEEGIVAGLAFIEKIYELKELEACTDRKTKEIYHSMARIKVSPDANIDFNDTPDGPADLSFVSNLDSRNFEVVKKGTRIGFAKSLKFLMIEDNKGRNITEQFLKIENRELVLARTFIPSMFTKDIYVMKEDCLGYVMEVMLALHTP